MWIGWAYSYYTVKSELNVIWDGFTIFYRHRHILRHFYINQRPNKLKKKEIYSNVITYATHKHTRAHKYTDKTFYALDKNNTESIHCSIHQGELTNRVDSTANSAKLVYDTQIHAKISCNRCRASAKIMQNIKQTHSSRTTKCSISSFLWQIGIDRTFFSCAIPPCFYLRIQV